MKVKLPKKLPVIPTTNLKYSDRPLLLGSKVEELTVQQFVGKFQQRFEYSDNVVLDVTASLEHQTYKNTDVHNSLIRKFLQRGFTDPSAFVVCNMGEVGHGLFADRDFEPCEVFILYAGKLVNKSTARSDYLLEVNERLDNCIDSSQSGNLARFIQHMPFSYDKYLEESEYYPGPKLDRSDPQFWEFRNLIYKDGLQPSDIAWDNLARFPLVFDGKVYSIIYNTRKITRGGQLGMSYGIGYWSERAKCPALFNIEGALISPKKYGFREVMISLPPVPVFTHRTLNKKFGFVGSYTKEHFFADNNNEETASSPVYFHHFCDAVSLYDLRDLLTQFHVLDDEYLPIESDFILKLRQIMPVEYRVSLYSRNPLDTSQSEIFDLIFRTHDLMKWSQLTAFLKGPVCTQLNLATRCFKSTQEVLFMNVGDASTQRFILQLLTIAKSKDLFTTPLKPEHIPKGPTRNDPHNLWLPSSQIYLAQIMRHNPGQTEQGIKQECEEVMKLISTSDRPEDLKSLQLSKLTIGFFNRKPSVEWKEYPINQLTGRYVGHNVRFYNIPESQNDQAEALKIKISSAGFDTQLITNGSKKSLVVDLSISNPKF